MSEIKPALSAVEWRAKRAMRGPVDDIVKIGDGYAVEVFYEGDEEYQCADVSFRAPEARHAIAALALHGQPFGFTHEDVRALQLAINGLLVHGMGYEDLVSIQTRIAALLPEP